MFSKSRATNRIFLNFYEYALRKVLNSNYNYNYMKIQVDIPNNINKHLKIERIKRDIKNMAELIIKILEERYKEKDG